MKRKSILELNAQEAIHAPTLEIAEKLCKKFHDLGLTWSTGETYLEYNNYRGRSLNYFPSSGTCSNKWNIGNVYTIDQLTDFDDQIYKVGDNVYHHSFGWGVVSKIFCSGNHPVAVDFDETLQSFTLDGRYMKSDLLPSLSFTEYDFVKGGFSQVRPLPDLKDGDLVYINYCGIWDMRYFSHFGDDGCIYAYSSQKKQGRTYSYVKYSLTNPLENE